MINDYAIIALDSLASTGDELSDTCIFHLLSSPCEGYGPYFDKSHIM